MPTKNKKNQGIYFNNYSYLAIRLEQSASFASLIRLHVNSGSLLFVAQMNTARCIGERQQKEYYKNTTADGQSYEGIGSACSEV